MIQRHLDKETEQVRSTWSINRGGRGTCVGVTRTTVSTDRNVKTCRDVSTGDSRNTSLELVIYSIKEVNKTVNNNKIS